MDTDNVYMVTIMAGDGTYMDTHDVMVTVTNVDEPGMVTLWASSTDPLTMAPQVGDTITGAVMDPDGGETVESWQWARSTDMSSWMDITDATNAAYMVTEGDEGHYLRVMATYTDAVGTDMAMEYSPATMMVTTMIAPVDPLVDKYDANENGEIERAEVFAAIDDYLDGGADAPTRADVFKLIEFYLGD